MDRYIYQVQGLDLIPGNKSAGFDLCVDPEALYMLANLKVSPAEQAEVVARARERAAHAELGNEEWRAGMNIWFLEESAAPRNFSSNRSMGGSLGADPKTFEWMQRPGYLQAMGQEVRYTPHNVDSPQDALLQLILVQTWGEWAQELLCTREVDPQIPPPLEAFDGGDLMTLQEFDDGWDSGGLTSDDGVGYYATVDGMSNVSCFFGVAPDWATHVVWFNR